MHSERPLLVELFDSVVLYCQGTGRSVNDTCLIFTEKDACNQVHDALKHISAIERLSEPVKSWCMIFHQDTSDHGFGMHVLVVRLAFVTLYAR